MSSRDVTPRNTDTYDADLNPVLEKATNEELQILHDIIVDRDTEDLTSHGAYKRLHPDHRRYADVIADEIREFGGNTFRNLVRGEGPDYIDVVRDVAKLLKAPFSDDAEIEVIEHSILTTIITKSMGEMPQEARAALIKSLGKTKLSVAGPVSAMAVQALLRTGGFASYKLMLIGTNFVVKAALGRGLAFAANTALTRVLSIAIGPVGWVATGLWTVISLGDPAYKITIPCVVYVAWLRAKQNSVECEKCGALSAGGGKYCTECGAELPPVPTDDA